MNVTRDDLKDLRQQIEKGFDGINARLDTLNGRTRANEQDVAVLKDRDDRSGKRSAAWGGLGVLVAGLLEGVHWWMSR